MAGYFHYAIKLLCTREVVIVTLLLHLKNNEMSKLVLLYVAKNARSNSCYGSNISV